MVRTNPSTARRLFAYYNLPREDRQAMRGTTNPSYQTRLNAFQHRPILPERGMKLDEIQDHRTVEITQERGWVNFIRQPEPYDAELVREFYVVMIPGVFDEFFTVRVRGRIVRMSMDDICLHYGGAKTAQCGSIIWDPAHTGGCTSCHSQPRNSRFPTKKPPDWVATEARWDPKERAACVARIMVYCWH